MKGINGVPFGLITALVCIVWKDVIIYLTHPSHKIHECTVFKSNKTAKTFYISVGIYSFSQPFTSFCFGHFHHRRHGNEIRNRRQVAQLCGNHGRARSKVIRDPGSGRRFFCLFFQHKKRVLQVWGQLRWRVLHVLFVVYVLRGWCSPLIRRYLIWVVC